MRIDLNNSSTAEVAAKQQTKQVTAPDRAQPSSINAEDTATFSTDTVAITDLTAKAMQSPEVRQDRVDALRQSIQNGTYKVDSTAVADAMIKDGFLK